MSESQDELVLADLKSIFAPLELPIMLVGAGARILVFDRFYQSGRFTEDLDIATQIPDWLTFDAVTQAMTQSKSALFQATKISHRFQHIATGKTIDVVLRYYDDEEGIYSGDSPGLMKQLATGEVQFLHAAIYLLGKDIRAVFRSQTLAQLPPIFDALLQNADPDDLTDAEQRLITLRQSIELDT